LIPKKEPQVNGGVENFNGRFQPRLFQRQFVRPGDLRQELARLQEAVNTQHVHPRLGGLTPTQHHRKSRLSKLPTGFVVPTDRQPIAAGRVCGDSPSRTSVRAAVRQIPSSALPEARVLGQLRPVSCGGGPSTTRGQDHSRIGATWADSSL
jgi:hypothetical protein